MFGHDHKNKRDKKDKKNNRIFKHRPQCNIEDGKDKEHEHKNKRELIIIGGCCAKPRERPKIDHI